MGRANCLYLAQEMASRSLDGFGFVAAMYGLNYRVGSCFDLHLMGPRLRPGWVRGGLHQPRRRIRRMVGLDLTGHPLRCQTLMSLFPDRSILSSLSYILHNSASNS